MLDALKIGEGIRLKNPVPASIHNVVVCGMGGSGIGGDLVRNLYASSISVPLIINKGYDLPAFVNEHTVVVLSSYSGNTEETLSCAAQCVEKGLKPFVVTTGGKLQTFAIEHQLDYVLIPGGNPPRSCVGYSVIQLLSFLHAAGLIEGSYKEQINAAAQQLAAGQKTIESSTRQLAEALKGKIVLAIAEDKYESAVLRLKQQINENSKMYCWYNTIPELNHNELVGWRSVPDNLSFLFFRAADENKRNTERILFTKKVAEEKTSSVYEVWTKGETAVERQFYLYHFGDWLSWQLADVQGVDAVEINVLNALKKHLETIG